MKKVDNLNEVYVVLGFIIIGLISYILYDQNIFNKKEIKQEVSQEIDKKDESFFSIYEALKPYTYKESREHGYQSFRDNELVNIALLDVTNDDFKAVEDPYDNSEEQIYEIKRGTLIQNLKKYFSKTVIFDINNVEGSFVPPHVNFESGSAMEFTGYEASFDDYGVRFGGIGDSLEQRPQIKERKIVKAFQKEDIIEIEEEAIYYKNISTYGAEEITYEIYKDPEMLNLIDKKTYQADTIEKETLSIDSYPKKTSTIITTFKKDKKTNKYYFVSSIIN